MFEVGFTEIILIVGLALLVLGPEKLPGLVNKVGRWTGRARSMARQLRMQLEHEVTLDELSKSRPMQGGPPPGSNASHEPYYDGSSPDYNSPVDATPPSTPEPVNTEAATGTDGPRAVDLSKPQQ